MTQRQNVEHKLQIFNEIKSIMGSMKNLALVEIRKLNRMRASHHEVAGTIHRALSDFFFYHPSLYPQPVGDSPLILLVGSERGFCGNFNAHLIESVEAQLAVKGMTPDRFIAVGNKLGMRMEGDPRLLELLAGPSAAEEVHQVLTPVLQTVFRLHRDLYREQLPGVPLSLWAAYHEIHTQQVKLMPVTDFPPPASPPGHGSRPHLNLPPQNLLPLLIEHYLMAVLTNAFYSSLMVENRFRLAHMENATRRMETKTGELTLKRNLLRQEEITQEVALILQSGEISRPGL